MNWAVVMAGGRGTRFWPESRNARPKPFLKLIGPRTLLEETVARLLPLFPPERILVVLQRELVGEARRLLKRLPRSNILGEPVGKNTAPCCVYAASRIAARDPRAKFVFLPADQYVMPKSLYLKTLRTAFQIADDRPVLLGMKPHSPQTGFGYLEVNRQRKKINGISYFTVRRFREKPGLAQAGRFLKRGNFFWNGGTFVWRLDAFKRAVKKYAPKIFAAWEKLTPSSPPFPFRRGGGRREEVRLRRIYGKLPSISLDYAVMEKMRNIHCLLAAFKWKDLGGWPGLAEFWPRDRQGNRIRPVPRGRGLKGTGPLFISIRAKGNLVKLDRRFVALLGVENLLVVDTPDALLIAPKSGTERIREVVRELERRKAWKYL